MQRWVLVVNPVDPTQHVNLTLSRREEEHDANEIGRKVAISLGVSSSHFQQE